MKHSAKTKSTDDRPWYRDGLRFECTGCGDCCTGAPGYVWVNEEEIAALAAFLHVKPEEFEQKHVRRVGNRKSLIELGDGDCVFFDNEARRCTVYSARPQQCRTWPFWESNLQSRRTWAETCRACPGCGQGKIIPLEEVRAQASVVRV